MLSFIGSSDIKLFVKRYFKSRTDLVDKIVVDLPAGDGYMSDVLNKLGASVYPYDLFIEFFKIDGLQCKQADLSNELPIQDNFADIVLCQEGLEHLPNQLFALKEFNRILKDNGTLIITVPNISHLRAKLSYFLTESDFYQRMPPNELDAVWFASDDSQKMYFGHIFLIGIQKLRVLAIAAGFEIVKIHKVKASSTSLFLGVLYPFIVLANFYVYYKNIKSNDGIETEKKKKAYWEIIKLNMHFTILFGTHLFIEFKKLPNSNNRRLQVNPRN